MFNILNKLANKIINKKIYRKVGNNYLFVYYLIIQKFNPEIKNF